LGSPGIPRGFYFVKKSVAQRGLRVLPRGGDRGRGYYFKLKVFEIRLHRRLKFNLVKLKRQLDRILTGRI